MWNEGAFSRECLTWKNVDSAHGTSLGARPFLPLLFLARSILEFPVD